MRRVVGLVFLSASVWGQQYSISTFAGGGIAPVTPAPALKSAIGQPGGIAVDAAGNLYFGSLAIVFKVDASGVLTRVAGKEIAGDSGDGGPAINAEFNSTAALALDQKGNLFIADAMSGRIRKVTTDGMITTVAGKGPGCCYNNGAGDGGKATDAQLFFPYQLAVDASGNVYIGEWNTPRVRKISADGIITTVVGNGSVGYSGDGGQATAAAIGAPWGLTFDGAGNLYFSDAIPGDDIEPTLTHIRKVTPDGIITTIAGTGDVGYAGDGGPANLAQFFEPGPLAVDSAGNVYVADSGRIRRISTDGTINTAVGNGNYGFAGDGGPAASAELTYSIYGQGLAITTDAAGNLYVADSGNYRVRKVSNGIISTVAGNGGGACCYSGDGGAATSAQLSAPVGVATDANGNVFIGDTFNNRVRMVSPAGVITTVAGSGVGGSAGNGGPATGAAMNLPAGLAVDRAGNVYVADSGNAWVRKISPDGTIVVVAGSGTSGYGGDGGAATSAQLNWPKDVTVDAAGNLYIADTVNNRVRKVSQDGTISTFVGESAGTTLHYPSGVALDAAGNLYVADTYGYRVLKVSTNGIITTVAGTGVAGYSGDGGAATSARLIYPTGVKVDAAGNLYIGDGGAVRLVSTDGTIRTVAGDGTLASGAWGIALDGAGNVFVADPWNNLVHVLKRN